VKTPMYVFTLHPAPESDPAPVLPVCASALRPSPHLDTKSRNMCIWSCSATVAIESLDFISRNSEKF